MEGNYLLHQATVKSTKIRFKFTKIISQKISKPAGHFLKIFLWIYEYYSQMVNKYQM